MKNAPKIKLFEVENLLKALSGLDGRQRPIKAADGSESTVFEAFDFSSKFTWNRVKNLRLLKQKLEDIQTRRDELRKKHGAVGSGEVPKSNVAAFFADYNALLEIEEPLAGGLTFTEAELNLFDPKDNAAGNRIPGSVLAVLTPFIA